MKYIFVIGAPGSKWSIVSHSIASTASDIDSSDYTPEREYHVGTFEKSMHHGAYFGPGMEFGQQFDRIETFSKQQCEQMFNEPFSGKGVRIIKSHVFAHKIDFLKQHWPECPVVLVHRDNKSCLLWWVEVGGFNIKYPTYTEYYKNIPTMAEHIAMQNADIMTAWNSFPGIEIDNNKELLSSMGMLPPKDIQEYQKFDIEVKLI